MMDYPDKLHKIESSERDNGKVQKLPASLKVMKMGSLGVFLVVLSKEGGEDIKSPTPKINWINPSEKIERGCWKFCEIEMTEF